MIKKLANLFPAKKEIFLKSPVVYNARLSALLSIMEEKRKKPHKTGRLFLFGRKNCLATPAIRKHS
jgi:hypothetical protein